MREKHDIDMDLLPIGYCEIRIIKNNTKNYSYKILYTNQRFQKMFSSISEGDNEDSQYCENLEKELFSLNKLKSYYNALINNSFMEFELYCQFIKKHLIIKVKPISSNLLGITIISVPSRVMTSTVKERSPNYAKILDNTFDLMLIFDKNFNIIFFNKEAKRILGIENDSQEFNDAFKYVHPEDQQLALEMINTLRDDPTQEIRSDIRILNKDNDYIVMHFLAKNMLEEEGINGFVINAIDVTEHNSIEKKLIENELYLESLFKAIPNLLFVIDYEGTFIDFKSYNNNNLAFSPDQFLGKKFSSMFPEYLSRKLITKLQQLKHHREIEPLSYQLKKQSGETGYFECHLSIIDEKKVLAVVNDVSALKKAEEKLTKSQTLIQKKLNAIIAPEGKLSDLELSDLIDIDELKDLFYTIHEFTNIPITLIDKNGNILFSIGMSDLCKDFHSIIMNSLDNCFRSNLSNTKSLKFGESRLYKCLNNIWNFVCPIYVGGEQIASLDICQFRLADDKFNYEEILRHQANIYNFDKNAYIAAYYSLPVLEKKLLIKVSSYYRDLLCKITALSYAQIKQARTANQLKLREEKLVQITDNMTDAFFIYNLDLSVNYISPSVKKMFGITPEEYKLKSLQEKFPATSIKILKRTLQKALEKSQDESQAVLMEIQEYHKNGHLIDLSVHAKLLKDENNQPIGIIGSARDISERKRAEEKLNRQLQLQSLLSSIAMQYINIPIEHINDSISKSLKEFALFAKADRAYIFSYDWEKGTTTNTYEWCNEGINPEIDNLQDVPIIVMQEWNDDHRAGKIIQIDNVSELAITDDRKEFLEKQNIKSLISVPLMNNNECIGFVGFDSVDNYNHYTQNEITVLKIFANLLVNIQNRIDLSKELVKEKERATESDKLKSNLLKNISHEFRTPLNGIIGLSELLQNKPIDSEYQKMANMILTSGIRLNYVLDSIMLLSQLESLSETKMIHLEIINLTNLMKELSQQFKGQIEQNGLDLIIDIQPDIFVKINDNLFKQAITHIINNSIKYTQHGSIKISCYNSQDNSGVKLNIEDTGIGIPKEAQAIIFNDFRQVSEGLNRAYEGCGLGLPIAKRAIELMQGEIILESEFGVGTKITIAFPFISHNFQADEAEKSNGNVAKNKLTQEDITSAIYDKPTILIVEDNKVNQKLAKSILSKYYNTDSAFNGETAIMMITNKQYDAILMDIHLGEGLDGLEVTKIIRNDLRYSHTPIIAVTGYTMLGDKEQILKAGCSHYLGKPYNKNQLLEILDRVLS